MRESAVRSTANTVAPAASDAAESTGSVVSSIGPSKRKKMPAFWKCAWLALMVVM